MNYRLGFFVILVVLVSTGVAGAVLFDRTIVNYMHLHVLNRPPVAEYTYLDPSYYDGVDMPPPLAYERHVSSPDDFAGWRDMLADPALHIDNNAYPEPVMLESPVPGVEKFLLGEIIVWHAAPASDNGRAVLVIPGSGDGSAREIMGIQTRYEPYHDEIGLRLAAAGYDAYTLELDGWGERGKNVGTMCPEASVPSNCEYFAFREKLARYGISLPAIHDREVASVLSYVTERHGWIAISSLSYGASRALTAALANADVLDAAVLASGIKMVHGWPMSVTACALIPPAYDAEDTDRMMALAPMPLYVSYGSLEGGAFGYAVQSGDIRDTVAPAYEMHGAPEAFTYVVHGGAHEYDVGSVIEFLDSH